MQNPASPPESRHTCPGCSRPVEPGNKFCATCGTRIPVLLTCSQCGTQFITPSNHCSLCGGTLILEEVPEPDDSPKIPEEDNTGTVEDQTLEQDEGEIPEPDLDELPDDNDQEAIVPPRHATPHHYKEEIQEPDTGELLEQYGKEYDDDETLESFHKPKHPAKKPVMVAARPGRVSSDTVDDALFLSPKKPGPSTKLLSNRTWIIGGCIVLIAVVAAVYVIGLPMLTERGVFSTISNPPAAEITPVPAPTSAGTGTPSITGIPAPSTRNLVPLPTQLIPTGQNLYFDVQKNPVTSRISVIFAGSAGEGSIKSADIKVTHPDGSVAAGIIQPLKGVTEITLDGSKETDRVEIIAQMSDGRTYRVYDALVPLMRL